MIKTIKYSEIKDLLDLHSRGVFISNPKFALVTQQYAESFSKKGLKLMKKYLKYISDCDFVYSMKGYWLDTLKSYAFGIAWSKNHSFNIMIDVNKKIWIMEPQLNKWYELDKIKKKKKYYPFQLVVI